MTYTLADSLQELLEHKHLTLAELSKETGIACSVLSYYKSETYLPSLKTAIKLADFFGCSLNFLVGLDTDAGYGCYCQPDYQFFARYQHLLEENGTSHYKICKKFKLNINVWRRWKSGSMPRLSTLIDFAKYFDVTVDYFVGRRRA